MITTGLLKSNAIQLGFRAFGMAKDTQLMITLFCPIESPITGPVADNDHVVFDVVHCSHNGQYFAHTTTQIMLNNLTVSTWRRRG
jgi:hypothetical protein